MKWEITVTVNFSCHRSQMFVLEVFVRGAECKRERERGREGAREERVREKEQGREACVCQDMLKEVRSQFSPSTFTKVQGSKLRPLGSSGKLPYQVREVRFGVFNLGECQVGLKSSEQVAETFCSSRESNGQKENKWEPKAPCWRPGGP